MQVIDDPLESLFRLRHFAGFGPDVEDHVPVFRGLAVEGGHGVAEPLLVAQVAEKGAAHAAERRFEQIQRGRIRAGIGRGLEDQHEVGLIAPRHGDVEFRHAFAGFQGVDDELDALAAAFAVAPFEFLDLPVQAFTDFDDAGDQRLGFGVERVQRPGDLAGDLLAGVVEPVGAALTILAASLVVPALPYLLSFAAGAMLYVVVEELIPEMSQGAHSNIGTVFFAVGFSLMMVLDVALG